MKDNYTIGKEEYCGMAALTICEALMLALNDHNILPEGESVGILQDAAGAHENADGPDASKEMHQQVAMLINRIIDGGNSVRRPETPMYKTTWDVKQRLKGEAKKRQLKTVCLERDAYAPLEASTLKQKAALLQDDVSNEEVLRILEQTEDRLNSDKFYSIYNDLAYFKVAFVHRTRRSGLDPTGPAIRAGTGET